MACDVHHHLRHHGISLYLGNRLQGIAEQKGKLKIRLQSTELEADMLVLAIGVSPESQLAQSAGLEINERGGILVDQSMRTSDEDIYAVGDAVEVNEFESGQAAFIPLAGPANKQGRIAADNICGVPSKYTGTQGSLIIKVFDMTVASTGINEKATKRLGLDYDKVYLLLSGHAGYYPGSKPMSMKVVFEKGSGRILGAQIVGFDGVDKRCDVLAVAIRAKMTANDLTQLELCYAPPYSSAKDPVNMAGYMIENLLNGKVKQIHWHDVDVLPRDGSICLLDVRSAGEVASGSVDGFINIPLDTLRKRIGELDAGKPVYALCRSGLRSYIACRILTQNGFDAFNIGGGYRLYSTVKNS
jgi:rhodanese-related sulfurtransferase